MPTNPKKFLNIAQDFYTGAITGATWLFKSDRLEVSVVKT